MAAFIFVRTFSVVLVDFLLLFLSKLGKALFLYVRLSDANKGLLTCLLTLRILYLCIYSFEIFDVIILRIVGMVIIRAIYIRYK